MVSIRNEDVKERMGQRNEDENKFDILLSGTTATLVIQTARKVYIGWVGDSRVTIWGNGNSKSDKNKGLITTDAHKPDVPAEMYRIYDNRGEIRETADGKHRIFLRARMYPGLKVSRTIGDLIPHQIGIISEPNTQVINTTNNDKLVILGTDGLWDFINPEELIDMLNEMNTSQRETHGEITTSILNKIKDINSTEGLTINDTTFIISHL